MALQLLQKKVFNCN